VEEIEALYPDAITKKIAAKEVFRVADKPEDYVEQKTTEYLEVRAKTEEDIDF
jgi:hypothetical protein